MPINIRVRNAKVALEKAREHFKDIIKTVSDQPALVLHEDSPNIIKGAKVTAVIFLDRFVENMFGDLIETEDYRIDSWKKRNEDGSFCIDEPIFNQWKTERLLTD